METGTAACDHFLEASFKGLTNIRRLQIDCYSKRSSVGSIHRSALPLTILLWTLYGLLLAGGFYWIYRIIVQGRGLAPPQAVPQQVVATKNQGGIKVEVLECGSGPKAGPKSILTVHYEGYLESGHKVDSSYDRGTSYEFKLGTGDVIYGWEEGMKGMQAGEKRRITIPPQYAYGKKGKGKVPPNAVLIFVIKLLELK